MTKLVDLFNEYNRSPEIAEGEPVDERTETEFFLMSKEKRAYMLSKDFGWIKWLVDNDKIDKEKFNYCRDNFFDERYFGYGTHEYIIMMLAIQDEPIEFLISILK